MSIQTPDLFDDPPCQRHSTTSREAAVMIVESASTLRKAVLNCIRIHGAAGMTDEEIQDALDMEGSTERPRRRELQIAGAIVDSGCTRKTRSGRSATIWRAA